MAQQDVDLVRALGIGPEIDWAAVVRDEAAFVALTQEVSEFFDPSLEVALVGVTESRARGLAGLRQVWLEWLEPWASYRTVEEALMDLDDGRVLYLGRDFGGRRDGEGEVALRASAIWTVSGGRVTDIVFYASREVALEAAGVPAPDER